MFKDGLAYKDIHCKCKNKSQKFYIYLSLKKQSTHQDWIN